MIWIDALIDRLMVLGLGCSLVFSLYLLLRKWLKQKISGRVRWFAWLFVLLLPFWAIPWPVVITVPADAPSWIYAGRLPDLSVPYPDIKRVPSWPAEQNRQQGITQTEKTTQTTQFASTRTAEVLPHDSIPWLWFLSRQNLARSLFLAAVLLLLLVRLYQARKDRRGQGRALPAVALTSDDWLQDLAQARDTVSGQVLSCCRQQ